MPGSSILIVSSEVGRGRHQFVAEDIRHLAGRGWSVGLLSWGSRPWLRLRAFHRPRILDASFPRYFARLVKRIREPRDVLSTGLVSALASGISAALRRSNYGIVHAHFAFPEGIASVLASSVPTLITVHGYDVLTAPELGYGIRLREMGDELVGEALRSADLVMVANEYMKGEVSKIYAGNVEVVPNAVDTELFRPDVTCPDGWIGNYIFALKHHTRVSGLETLVRAFASVARGRDIRLVLGGVGPLTPKLRRLAARLGVSERVTFTGPIPHHELPCYYKMSRFVVVPSLVEAFGLSAAEAMACGRPVIASDTGGLRELVEDGLNGFRFPPGDWERLAGLMEILLDDPAMARELGLNGRRRILEKYDMRIRMSRLEEVYRRFL